jgi:predicted nucleotidyltransferase component of viral defense system
MIPEIFIQAWRKNALWQTYDQIEQDLIISRTLVDLYNDPHISEALIFRGGTALNKLFLKPPSRYSEDIDFVQKNSNPIGQTIDAIRELFKPWLGDPKWKITDRSAKLIYKYESINKMPAKLKIEINTTEHFQVLPLKTVPFTVASDWFNGASNIITYELDELMATKLRALYQRRKGRDLFDLWFVAQNNLINVDRVFEIFKKYCVHDNYHFSRDEFLKNLELKRNHQAFQSDMHALLPVGLNWNFEESYQFVVDNVISRLP